MFKGFLCMLSDYKLDRRVVSEPSDNSWVWFPPGTNIRVMNICVCSVSGCIIYISITFVFPLILITVTQVLSYLARSQINVCDVVQYLYLYLFIFISSVKWRYFTSRAAPNVSEEYLTVPYLSWKVEVFHQSGYSNSSNKRYALPLFI